MSNKLYKLHLEAINKMMLTEKLASKSAEITEQIAVAFAEWFIRQDITSRGKESYVTSKGVVKTTKELFQEFLKTKE